MMMPFHISRRNKLALIIGSATAIFGGVLLMLMR